MKSFVTTCCLLLVVLSAFGTHLRAGFIQVERANPISLTYRITVTVYTNSGSTPVLFGGDTDISYVYFGDGEKQFIPETANIIRYDLDPAGTLATASFTTTHTYSTFGSYKIHYSEPNRNGGILNCSNSITSLFYIETYIVLDAMQQMVSTPSILAEPVFYTATGSNFSYSLASKDSTDKSLFYELTNPQTAPGQSLVNYQIPENFSINPVNGLITWDTKFHEEYHHGEYAFAARIYQYSEDLLLGYMTFDFQIILEGDNESNGGRLLTDNRDLDENGRIHAPTGSSQKIKVFAEDVLSGDDIELKAYSELTGELLPPNVFTFSSYDSTQGDRKIRVGVFEARNNEAITRDNPYAIVVRARYVGPEPYVLVTKDIGYLFYTKDVELEFPEIVMSISDDSQVLTFYPNPVKDFIFLDDKVKSVKLLTLDGNQIIDQDCSNKTVVDLRQVQPGVYLLQLRSHNNKQYVARLVKE